MKNDLQALNEAARNSPGYAEVEAYEDLVNRVAERIEEYRHAAGLTQRELGQRVGKGQSHVARIEGGYENITLKTLSVIALALGRDPVDLVKPHRSRALKRSLPVD